MAEHEQSEANFADLRLDEGNKISCNVVAGYIYTKARKVFQESFADVYEDLLSRIAHDYHLELGELREKYPLEVNVTKRKPRDPANACTALTKKGDQCTFPRKTGYEYCGIHLKKMMNNDYGSRGMTGPALAPVPSAPTRQMTFKNRNGGTYRPKKESDAPSVAPSSSFRGTYQPKTEEELDEIDRIRREEERRRREEREEEERNLVELRRKHNQAEAESEEDDEEEYREIEIEIEEIEGEQFLVCGENIYYYPPDADISSMILADLTKAGVRNGKEIDWL